MSTKQFSKDWRFQQLVRIAVKRRLTYREAIALIQKNGYPKISDKTYQRTKTELKASEHLKDISIEGFAEYSLDTITTTAAVDQELWELVRSTNDPWVRLRAIKMIMENCPKKSEDFESGKAFSYVANELEAAKAKKKELEKTQTAKEESGTTVTKDDDNHVGKNSEPGSS